MGGRTAHPRQNVVHFDIAGLLAAFARPTGFACWWSLTLTSASVTHLSFKAI